MNIAAVEDLIAQLLQASQAYYQEMETSPLTDEEYDDKLTLLAELAQEEEYAHLFPMGSPAYSLLEGDVAQGSSLPQEATTVAHQVPMLSLGKAKSPEELTAWVKRARAAGAQDFRLQVKLDGFALAATYQGGRLTRLATRGTGTMGEDVTYLLRDPQVTIKGLPLTLTEERDLEVRGELFFTDQQFQDADNLRHGLTGERFKNSRNAIVGLMKKAKLGVDYPVEFTYSTYSAFQGKSLITLTSLPNLGLLTVDALTQELAPQVPLTSYQDDAALLAAVEAFGRARENFTVPNDGVVVKPTNESLLWHTMGFTSHHPSSQVAYKYPGEVAQATILALTFTVGKTGKVTPVAKITPAHVGGTVIENVSCHNFNWLWTHGVRVGSVVMVTRANDVIPFIRTVVSNPQDSVNPPVLEACPVCATTLTYDETADEWPPKTLLCSNMDCPSRDFFALKTAVAKNFLHIDGLADATLTHLNETGRLTTIADFYTLTLEELADATCGYSQEGNPRRLGEKRALNILEHIEKSKDLPLWRLLASLNIAGLGFSTAKLLVKAYPTLEALQAATVEEVAHLEGVAELTAEKIVTGLAHRAPLIALLKERGVKFTPAPQASQGGALQGLSFSISGRVPAPFENRQAWVAHVEAQGGTFHSSPKATTSYLVGDPEDTSSKVKAALRLQIPFLTPEEFTSRYSG